MLSNIPGPTIPGPVDETCRHWQAVRARLAETIQDFSEACDALNSVLSYHSGAISLDQPHLIIDAELPALARDIAQLSDAQRSLSTNRNHSRKLVPINRLPNELLARIFLAAVRMCVRRPRERSKAKCYIYPTTLAGVCRAWRKAAISLPSLWSHIDIALNGKNTGSFLLCAKTWVERAQNSPLFVDLISDSKAPSTTEKDALELLNFLTPLANNIGSIRLFTNGTTGSLGRRILASWVLHGSLGSMRLLDACRLGPSPTKMQPWDPSPSDSFAPPPPAQADEFFRSVQYLHLWGFSIPWTSAAYHGLVHLTLEGSGSHKLTQSQLAVILQSSPRLRYLNFSNVEVQPEQWSELEPIFLADLEVLEIEENSHLILPLLAPGTKPLKMAFCSNNCPGSSEILRSFFARSIVETLHMDGSFSIESWFSSVLGPLKHLKNLLLSNCSFDDDGLNDFLSSQSSADSLPWPKLNALYLSKCRVLTGPALQLLSQHSIQRLRIHLCRPIDDSAPESDVDQRNLWLKIKLSEAVPDTNLSGDPIPLFLYE